jgi:hypothetical protein
MCLITCVGTMAQSVSFSGSGTTLVITASGNLTGYTMDDDSKKEFTSAAASLIAKNDEGWTVIENEEYNASTTYYYHEVTSWGDALNSGAPTSNMGGVSFNVWTSNGTTYYTTWATGVYVSHDNGKTKELLATNTNYTYQDGDLFYHPTMQWTKIDDNTTFFKKHTDLLKSVTQNVSIVEAIENQMTSGGYTSFKFVKKSGGDDIKISKDQMQTLLNDFAQKNKAYLLDFAQVTGISATDMPVGPTNVNQAYISWVLPNSLTDAEKETVAAKANDYANMIWFSDLSGSGVNKPSVHFYVKNSSELTFLPEAVATEDSYLADDKIINIIVTGTINGADQTMMKNFDIQYTKNLDLHKASVNPAITPLWFDGDKYLSRVIFPDSFGSIDDWYTNSAYQDFIKNEKNSCKIFQKIKDGFGGSKNVFQTVVMNTGRLENTEHYYHKDFSNCESVDFYGILNDDDVEFLQKVATPRLNLFHAKWEGAHTNLDAFTSSTGMLKYLALPDLNVDPSNFKTYFTNNSTLLGVAQYNSTTTTFSGALQNRTDEKAEGTMNILTYMVDHVSAYTKVKMSGDLKANDIIGQAIGQEGAYLSKDGHWTTKDASDYAGDANQYGALQGHGTITSFDFSDARFANNEDLNLYYGSMYSGNYLTELLFPTDKSFTKIAAHSCENMGTGMTKLIIPGNIQDIDDYSLRLNASIHDIMTTKTDDYGNGSYASDMIIDNGDKSFTLPAGLKHIGHWAFALDDWIHDVYSLNPVAPECERDAFASNTYTGNNGFDAQKGVNQDAYMKETNSFAVLHYPSTVDEENLERYTDPTRVYTLADDGGATDANGKLLMWPSQKAWNHAYITAYTGYTWGAWDMETTNTNQWSFASCTETNGTITPDVSSVVTDKTKTYDQKYTGWHQFILVNAMNSKKDKDDPVRDFSRFKQNDWYTICVPYNIRKSDLQRIFGVTADDASTVKTVTMADGTTKTVPSTGLYPDVVTLTAVERNEANGTITLLFSKNLINTDITVSSEGGDAKYTNYTDDDPIVIKEGHPYLIRPYLPADKLALAKEGKYTVNMYDYGEHVVADGTNIRIPYEKHIIEARDANKQPLSGWKYRFGGAYYNYDLPQYSYYLSHSKSKKKNAWFYLEGSKAKSWNMYSAIVAANVTDTKTIPTSDQAKNGENPVVKFAGVNDDFPESPKAKQYIMSFENETATGISMVQQDKPIVYVDGHAYLTNPNVRIYKIDGQYVGHSLENLPEGIYIINGKKYLIK